MTWGAPLRETHTSSRFCWFYIPTPHCLTPNLSLNECSAHDERGAGREVLVPRAAEALVREGIVGRDSLVLVDRGEQEVGHGEHGDQPLHAVGLGGRGA